jgi:hypothetical protein
MTQLAVITAHAGASCIGDALLSWGGNVPVFVQDGHDGILPAYQRGFEAANRYGVLAYLHDDLLIRDSDWYKRVLVEFDNPQVGLIGFGGALRHGTDDLYREPYDLHQLGRDKFMSNMVDAEVHGKRFTESCDVAVLDGFSLIVRSSLLHDAGGWPTNTLGYVGYDYWLCCMAHRIGYRIRVVGIACHHLGGQTFVKLGMGTGDKHWQQYIDAHFWLYNEFRDVLPFRCE